jgi:hypothetical protein
MSAMNPCSGSGDPGATKLAAYAAASASPTSPVKPTPIAGFGRNAVGTAAGPGRGGVPKIAKPAASGRWGSASTTMWPPRLQPTNTASSTPSTSANPVTAAVKVAIE